MEVLRNIRRGAGVAAAAAVLAACATSPELTEDIPATVVEHEHTDAWTQFIPVKIGKVFTVMPIRHPEHWELTVRQCGHEEFMDEQNTDGCGEFVREVNEETYNEFADGDIIVFHD